ncbi:GILT-like protein 1 [Hyposmocoma kahamanoa]|uniref:GILT-like protein 1 n=1 Tax=Hyposmocoma kahamanoa TaxID=1477025 RepID=UPI000E6D8223|nr:GILT-like protein 1 [Hyposmocoma kahamanoa]
MRTMLVACLVALFCGAMAKGGRRAEDNKVKVAVYYESLCPDSKKFIVEQLAPVWRDFRGAIKVKLVPYGKATHDRTPTGWQFICHHGPNECYGNKVQACILKDRSMIDTEKMDLIICLMGTANPDKSLDMCLAKFNKAEESEKLTRCANGEQGDNLLASYGDKSDAVLRPLQFVPTVVINEKFNQTTQDLAYSNLKEAVCNAATVKPPACQ